MFSRILLRRPSSVMRTLGVAGHNTTDFGRPSVRAASSGAAVSLQPRKTSSGDSSFRLWKAGAYLLPSGVYAWWTYRDAQSRQGEAVHETLKKRGLDVREFAEALKTMGRIADVTYLDFKSMQRVVDADEKVRRIREAKGTYDELCRLIKQVKELEEGYEELRRVLKETGEKVAKEHYVLYILNVDKVFGVRDVDKVLKIMKEVQGKVEKLSQIVRQMGLMTMEEH